MIGQQFDTPEDALAHFGKKGMKWGVRNESKPSSGGGGGGKKAAKPGFQDIYDARDRTQARQALYRVEKAKNKTATGRDKTRSDARLAKMKMDYLKSPDRATALRLTKGEKIMFSAYGLVVPVAGTVGVGIGVGTRVATRKVVERSIRKANAKA